MKYFGILILLVLSISVFASDCETYGKKAVSCYEKGHLSNYYDETGDGCGELTDNIWEVEKSTNTTVKTSTIETYEYSHMGGYSWESVCFISFINTDGKYCTFNMKTSVGTEDGDISIRELMCK